MSQQHIDQLIALEDEQFAKHGYTDIRLAYLTKGDGTGNLCADKDGAQPRFAYVRDVNNGSNIYVAYMPPEFDSHVQYVDGQTNIEKYEVRIGKAPSTVYYSIIDAGSVGGQQSAGTVTPAGQVSNQSYWPASNQFSTLRASPTYPTATGSIFINGPYVYLKPSTGVPQYFPLGSPALGNLSLTSTFTAIASGKHQLAVPYLDLEAGTLGILTNTAVTAAGTLPSPNEFAFSDVQGIALTDTQLPIAVIYLYNGQTTIIEANFYRSWDMRPLFQRGTGDVLGPSSATDGDFALFNGTSGKKIKDTGLSLTTDGTLAANSDSLVPSEKAVKTYTAKTIAALADKFLLQTPDITNLPNAQAMSALATGLVKNTTTTGVQSIAAAGTDYTSPGGAENLSNKTITSSTLDSTPIGGSSAAAGTFTHETIAGTAGNGYEEFVAQSVGVSAPSATGLRLWAKSTGFLAWVVKNGSDTFARIFAGTLTADHTYTLKDADGTIAFTSDIPAAAITQLTGDVTAGPGSGSQAATLATVNSNVGTFAGPLSITANAKGLITAIATTTVNLATQVAGLLGLAHGGTGVDLSASGSTTAFLAQDGSHVVSARSIVAVDVPNLDASKITSGQLTNARGGSGADTSATGGIGQFWGQATSGAVVTSQQMLDSYAALPVVNTSGGTANPGDAGYLDYSATNGGFVYKTTTTANFNAKHVAVLIGGTNTSTIYVIRRGTITLNYTGSAPAKGDFLTLSATAGKVQTNSLMRYEAMALATAAGSGSVVTAILMTQTLQIPTNNANNIWSCAGQSTTLWTGTISSSVSTTSFTVTTSAGSLNCFTPSGTLLANVRLYNTTRSNTFRLVSSISGSTITTIASSDAWANGDSLTIESLTVVSGLGNKFMDLDLSQSIPATISPTCRGLVPLVIISDTSTTLTAACNLHAEETFSAQKQQGQVYNPNAAGGGNRLEVPYLPLIGGVFAETVVASGAGTGTAILRLFGFLEATP